MFEDCIWIHSALMLHSVCVCVSRKWCTYIDTKLHNLHIVNLRFSHIAGDCSVWNTYYASSVEPHNQYLDLELDKWWGTNQCLIIFPPTKYWKRCVARFRLFSIWGMESLPLISNRRVWHYYVACLKKMNNMKLQRKKKKCCRRA